MAVPGSGAISLGQIRQELQTANYAGGAYTAAATGLDPAENGTYATINTCSPSYPLSANPAKMSEWYGYDHDAPCSPSSGSYYAYSGGAANGYLKFASTDLTRDPERLLQCDLQDTWALSMWVQPGDIKIDTSFAEYAREYPLWSWYDNNNGYEVSIVLIARNTSNPPVVNNQIEFAIDAGSGNARVWTVVLDDQANSSTTGLSTNNPWSLDTLGNTNDRDFVNLIFRYDYNAGTDEDKFIVYWNGTALTTTSYYNAGGPSGLTFGNTDVLVGKYAAGMGAEWFGRIDWISYVNGYNLQAGDAATIWNSGLPYTYSNLYSNINASFVHWNLNGGSDPEVDESNSLELVYVNTPQYTTSIFA